jgi:hypothetical protein
MGLHEMSRQHFMAERKKARDTARSDINIIALKAWEDREARITLLEASRPLLIKYAQQKLDAEDFHGLADAAMDLRDLDSELDGLRY